MKLTRRFLLSCGPIHLAIALLLSGNGFVSAQDASRTNHLVSSDSNAKDFGLLSRPGAASLRFTPIVRAVDRVKACVVNIHSERNVPAPSTDIYSMAPTTQNRVNGMGTGIIVDPRGYIITNHHVVEDVSLLRIRLADGTTQNATIVARSPEADLAIIRIQAKTPLQVMPIGTALDLMVGETVIAVGNAYGYEHTVSTGIVSAVKRDVSLNKEMQYKALIQTDAAINPGNSGGPLINIYGDLVGVNVAIRAGAQNIGFAIPADSMVRTVADLFRGRRRMQNYDGIIVRDQVDTTHEIPVRSVFVDRIDPDSPAALAGLKTGDLIEQVGDAKVVTSIDVERGLLEMKAGESAPFFIRRDGREQRIDVVLASADKAPTRSATPAFDVVWQKLGLQLTPISGETVAKMNRQLNGGLEVTNVQNESPAARAGIKKGDILVGLHQWETLTVDNVQYVLTHPELPTFSPLSFYILRQGQVRRGYLTNMN
jgi:serine protease Do